MPRPQPVSPAQRQQLRWGLFFLAVQLALQSYLIWSRATSGFGEPNLWFAALVAAGWGVLFGGLLHSLWRGPLHKWHVAAMYTLPALALSLPVAAQAWSVQTFNAEVTRHATPNEQMYKAAREFITHIPALSYSSCSELFSMQFEEPAQQTLWQQVAQELQGGYEQGFAECYGASRSGPLVAELLPQWIEEAGGRNVVIEQNALHGNWANITVQADLPRGGSARSKYVPIQINLWGLRHVNRTTPLTETEQQLVDRNESSFLVMLPVTEQPRSAHMSEAEQLAFAAEFARFHFSPTDSTFRHVPCGLIALLEVPEIQATFESHDPELNAVCYGAPLAGQRFAEVLPQVITDEGGTDVQVDAASPDGLWLVGQASANVRLHADQAQPTLPAQFVYVGLAQAADISTLSENEQMILESLGVSSVVIAYGAIEQGQRDVQP